MSAHTTHAESSIESDDFTSLTGPSRIHAADIPRMAAPDQLTDDEPRSMAFAVGHRAGVVHNEHAEREYGATAVLYMTRDEEVVERWISGDVTDAPRACIVADAALEAAGAAAWLADALGAHPEVDA